MSCALQWHTQIPRDDHLPSAFPCNMGY